MNKKIAKWSLEDIESLYHLPFNDLIYKAQTIHRENHDPNKIQVSTLMSIKTGGCPEDCKYCSQSIKYNTDVEIEKLLSVDDVVAQARLPKTPELQGFVWELLGGTLMIVISPKLKIW
mgnify:CR=1 FL=1